MRRFSLRAILLLCLIVALLISNVSLLISLKRLGREVQQLRRETGRLVPVGGSKINIMAVPQSAENVWQWRVYSPEQATMYIRFAVGDVPVTGTPTSTSGIRTLLPPTPEWGSLWTLTVSRNIDGNYVMKLLADGGGGAATFSQDQATWLEGSGSFETAGTREVETYNYGEPIVLRRVRLVDPATGSTSMQPSPGYMVWVVPRKGNFED